jgi:hypothetical protein
MITGTHRCWRARRTQANISHICSRMFGERTRTHPFRGVRYVRHVRQKLFPTAFSRPSGPAAKHKIVKKNFPFKSIFTLAMQNLQINHDGEG